MWDQTRLSVAFCQSGKVLLSLKSPPLKITRLPKNCRNSHLNFKMSSWIMDWLMCRRCLCFRAVIGEIDEETDSTLDLGNIRAEPLNSVVH